MIVGTACAIVVATSGATWALSTEGPAPAGSIVLIWGAVLIALASWIFGATTARRTIVGRIRATDHMQRQVDQLRGPCSAQ